MPNTNWVLAKVLSEKKGYTIDQIKHRRCGGIWLEGIEWKWVDRRIHYDLVAINRRGDNA